MKLKLIAAVLLLLVFSVSTALAADPGQAFGNLKLFDLEGIRFYYLPESSRLVNETEGDNEDEIKVRVLVTKLDIDRPEEYLVMFDHGPSEDPSFALFRIQGDKLVPLKDEKGEDFWVAGLDLILPGHGSFYVAGHTNNMFDMRRKFTVDGGVVREVKQPFYFVGLDSETTEDINLYASTRLDKAVAFLPQGTKVSVLLNQGDYYLLKTNFGLVGWIKVAEYAYETPIKGLRYAGD